MRRRALASSLTVSLLLLSLSSGPRAARATAFGPAADCEGGACQYVSVAFDEAKGEYRVQSSSSDRWIKVAASNVAAFASVCVGPGKTEHLPLKSILGAYRAEFAESGCAPQGGA